MSARETILRKLKAVQPPFDIEAPDHYHPMVPLPDSSPAALKARFILEAEKLSCKVHQVADDESAIEQILALIGEDRSVMSWDFEHIGIQGLEAAFSKREIRRSAPRDGTARIGLTGADAALAGTGSLIVSSGKGKPRQASLLPPTYVAVIRSGQIIAGLEDWFVQQRTAGLDTFRRPANHVVISGPSKTADIGQELIHGAHGPREVHIVLVDS